MVSFPLIGQIKPETSPSGSTLPEGVDQPKLTSSKITVGISLSSKKSSPQTITGSFCFIISSFLVSTFVF
jgi:hypothetical protein